ncbi:transglycosylase SLT domain-containing protein [Streptomyces sp. NPDC101160]|uniref:transglycosylase SLT domain-containing protein n=1 Tax=Streptomyces sp. NPDC101160 TaxID=3366118 RepID=UPI00382735C2
MRGHGKHRRPKRTPLARSLAVAGLTGSAALAVPLAGASSAVAAEPHAAQTVAVEKAVTQTAVRKAVQAGPVRYSVVVGDSLSGIAEKYAVRGGWKKLYQDNRRAIGHDPRLIRPGLKLTVDPTSKQAPTAPRLTGAGASEAGTATAVQASAPAPAAAATTGTSGTYANNLDGWIREALDVMARNGIPGSYDGIYRNIMRESSGNPQAINNWDSNAVAGTPSKGLLQVIDPTFQAYHVAGTSDDIYDPVANITAACNYAAAKYGSIDNVFGAY